MIQTMLIMMAVGLFAGIAGAILGLGGGIIITPVLTLMMGLDIKYAIGASIIYQFRLYHCLPARRSIKSAGCYVS